MRVIDCVFYTPNKHCLIVVGSDDGYFIGEDVDIMDGDKCVLKTSITSIDKIKRSKSRGLYLLNVPDNLIKQNMTINKNSPV